MASDDNDPHYRIQSLRCCVTCEHVGYGYAQARLVCYRDGPRPRPGVLKYTGLTVLPQAICDKYVKAEEVDEHG